MKIFINKEKIIARLEIRIEHLEQQIKNECERKLWAEQRSKQDTQRLNEIFIETQSWKNKYHTAIRLLDEALGREK